MNNQGSKSGRTIIRNQEPGATRKNDIYGKGWGKLPEDKTYGDSGGASRFFYQAKASKRDRNEGLEELERSSRSNEWWISLTGKEKAVMESDIKTPVRQNFHPTVKPTQLMRYLIKLVTPAGGVVLDPFTGSGSTGKAALLDGFKFVGVELDCRVFADH
jgi:site-specific DNA-methyltransferase (adenine-specific)